jgi:D-alanyl-D-alanine carboxypeptidase/D-alanyl-D-alanine-endopeptidase (penicillin-binding protein 4)
LISRQAPPSVDLRLVDRHFSPPLREIARRMVTDERTLDAEVLLKALGAQRSGGEGSTTDGGMAVVDYLSGLGVHTHGMAVLDGSGLSSFNRVSARQIVEAMRAVLRGPDADLLRLIVPTYVPNLVGDAGLALLAASPAIRAVEGRIAGAHVLVGWTEGDARPPMAFALLVRGDKPAVEPVVSSHLAALARELASPPSAPAGARR